MHSSKHDPALCCIHVHQCPLQNCALLALASPSLGHGVILGCACPSLGRLPVTWAL